ncbi:MAG TPA: DUF6599 family protein [Terriglobales bacterium]|jgi:hypothetical protein|nr:DUF6599 family protein [Terriglobales bacterium]
MRRRLQLVPLWLLLAALPAGAAAPALLPSSFSGWQLTEHHTGRAAAQADAVNADALSEFGFTDYEQATYERSGRKLYIKAARFSNATGSYGAFTLFTQPDMIAEQIGDGALVSNGHILFYKADVLVDAVFEKPTVMSAAELRALSDSLQTVSGGAASLPEPVKYLPSQSYLPGSSRYAVGPATFSRMDSILPASIAGFDKSAEVATGDYRTGNGIARLTILSYPTPQIAMQHFRTLLDWLSAARNPAMVQPQENARLEEARKPSFQGTLTLPLNTGTEVTFRRSGPLVILVSGSISKSEAISLVQSVNYDADVRMLQPTPVTASALSRLIVGCFVLVAMIVAVFLVLGLFVGGTPFLLRRMFPNREFKHSQDIEIIKLNLRD